MGNSKSQLPYSSWVSQLSLLPTVDVLLPRDDALALWLECVRDGEDKDAEKLGDLSLDPDLDLEDDTANGKEAKGGKGSQKGKKGAKSKDDGGHRRTATASSQMMAALRESTLNLRLDAELSTIDGKFHPLYHKLCERYGRIIVEQNESKIGEYLKKRAEDKAKGKGVDSKGEIHIQQSLEKYKKYFLQSITKVLENATSESQFLRACRSSRNLVRKVEFIEVAAAGGTMKSDGSMKWKLFNVYRGPIQDEPISHSSNGLHSKTNTEDDDGESKVDLDRKVSGGDDHLSAGQGKPGNVRKASTIASTTSLSVPNGQPRMPGLARLNSTSKKKAAVVDENKDNSDEKGADREQKSSSSPSGSPRHQNSRQLSSPTGFANFSVGSGGNSIGGASDSPKLSPTVSPSTSTESATLS